MKKKTRNHEDRLRGRPEVRGRLAELFSSQSFAVLATQKDGQPFTNLVAFAATEDLKHLLFATPRATRKFRNLSADARVAMMIDNRSNRAADLQDAAAVMAKGVATEVAGDEKTKLLKLYLSKHPYLKAFVSSPTCALFKILVDKYDMATHFQNVLEYDVTP